MGVSNPIDIEFNLEYKAQIEKMRDEAEFLERGDELFLAHPDSEARILWSFYRPIGSHLSQLEDNDVWVSIMAFNHSRLRPLQRFSKLHKNVIPDDELRHRIHNRARMLFRAMADEDFTELLEVVKRWPVYIPLAADQIINGRKMNEDVVVDLVATSQLIDFMGDYFSDKVFEATTKRMTDIIEMELDEFTEFLDELLEAKKSLHFKILEYYQKQSSIYMERHQLHKLQKLTISKKINALTNN